MTLPALRFASHRIAPQAASAGPVHHFSTFFSVLPTGLALCPKAGILESRRNYKRLAGLSPLPVALHRRGADPSLNNQTCSLRAKPACCDFARLALLISQHRSASSKRKPRSPLQHFVFGTPDRLGIMPQGRHTGMKTEYSVTTAARIVVLPRVHGPRANLRQES